MKRLLFLFLLCVWLPMPLWAAEPLPPSATDGVDYTRDIQPLLARYCVDCHGAETQESGLRLDTAAGAMLGGNRGPAITASKPAESLLIQALSGTSLSGAGDIPRMPPEDTGDALAANEIELLRRWIEAGAVAPAEEAAPDIKRHNTHWAYQPIARVPLPAVEHPGWVRNSLDAFVLAKQEAAGLAPSSEADRVTLIRRLSLDLLGLPPSRDEVAAFLADSSPDAYEKLVERLLASPHYGERWGRHWLDVARYADSNGYTIDGGRSIWKYRDWVINAINRDLPFDQFGIEQLAGDMLPDATLDQQIATGFHRNTLVNEEGGTDPEQFRVEAVVDRVSTTSTAFMGLTVACARCHDHKYDAISQREFYQLFALFNNADEPTLSVPTDKLSKELPALEADIAQVETRLTFVDANIGTRQADWEKLLVGQLEPQWTPLPAESAISTAGATITAQADHSLLVTQATAETTRKKDQYQLTLSVPEGQLITAIRIEALTDDSLPRRGPGQAANGNFVLSEVRARWLATAADGSNVTTPLPVSTAFADHESEKGRVAFAMDGNPETGWNIYSADAAVQNRDHQATFIIKDDLPAPSGARLQVELDQQYEGDNYLLGRFRISITSTARESLRLSPVARAALLQTTENRTDEQKKTIAEEYKAIDPERVPLAAQWAELKSRQKQLQANVTTTLVIRERAEARPTFIHVRGDFLRPGARVTPGVLAVLPGLQPAGATATRLDFARWLFQADHPLTARVTVNRIWQHYFGQGLVGTENDFGAQGDQPTHPELLDHLATSLIDGRWSMKGLHRQIVTSATYRQSSRMQEDLAQIDPYNKLLARQPRLRLNAESIRDSALAASALLSAEIGGPGVYPPQPEGIYRFTQQVKYWKENQDADRYRRGMYTFFWRSSPYPFLKTFDTPDANVTCTRRTRSNTPLQSLTLANDRAFVELAQGLAKRVLSQGLADDATRIGFAFECCLARQPTAEEVARLSEFCNGQRAHYQAVAADAAALAPAGTPTEQQAETAVWVAMARVLFNLDEFITRD